MIILYCHWCKEGNLHWQATSKTDKDTVVYSLFDSKNRLHDCPAKKLKRKGKPNFSKES